MQTETFNSNGSEKPSFEYREVPVKSFDEAVSGIVDMAELVDNPYCFVDIDGTLIETYPYSVPGVCHTKEAKISDEINGSFSKLADKMDGNVAIITNRNRKEKLLWNSHKVLGAVDELTKETEYKIPFFTNLNRQVPFVAKEQIKELADFLSCRNNGHSCVDIFVIEDDSVISPNRDAFLRALGKELSEEYEIGSRVVNFVISKRV